MNIIVVGCGKIGSSVAGQLSNENHNITVVDIRRSAVEAASSKYDVIGVVGNGGSSEVMKEAGVETADLLLAMTGNDELNLLSCLLGRTMGKCKTIARIKNPSYESELDVLKEQLGLAMIVNSEHMAAEEVARLVRFPMATRIDTFNKGRVELLKYRIGPNSRLSNMRISDLKRKYNVDVLVCAVERGSGENCKVTIPDGDFVLQEKDLISFATTPQRASQLVKVFGQHKGRSRSCMIVGGGDIGYYLAKQLLAMGISVTLVEKDEERCEELCQLLNGAMIIHGDAIDDSILEEEGLADMDAFVALTNMDETNILLSLFASKRSNAKRITKVHSLPIDSLIEQLDLDSIICPKSIVADNISQYVRAMENSWGSNVETMYHLIGDEVEALEFIIKGNCPLVGKRLMDLKLKKGLVIACISHGKKVLIPNGQSTFSVGDSVIVVTTRKGLNDISDILA